MRSTLLIALMLAGVAAPARALPPLQIGDMARIVDLEEPAISPDGKYVALIAITQRLSPPGYVNALLMVDTRTGATRTLLRGLEVSVPRWSPDGSRLAYLARPAEGAPLQLFVRSINGAPLALTRAGGDVIDAEWSPDGKHIAYVAADAPSPRPVLLCRE